MSDESPTPADSAVHRGPVVDDTEELLRALTHRSWYDADTKRISSAAFGFPQFSVDIASIAGSTEATLQQFKPGTGLTRINCGRTKQIGCAVHQERDDRNPDNKAHAHVYVPGKSSHRKRLAQQILSIATLIVEPNFPQDDEEVPSPS